MNTTFLKPVQGRKWILLLFLSVWFLGNSQTKLRVEPGLLIKTQSENLGSSFNVEPHLEVSTRSVIGLRFGIAVNSQEFETISGTRFFIDEENDNAVISFVPTFDYYLNYAPTRPYLGVGVGYYFSKKRAVATGIAVCGTGCWVFCLAPLGKVLVEYYHWQNADRKSVV